MWMGRKISGSRPPAGHVCCRRSHTKESHDTEGDGWVEQWQSITSQWKWRKMKIKKGCDSVLPFWLCDSSMFSSIVAGYKSLCLCLVWSSLKPLASSQHSVRVCVYVGGCVCVSVFFSPPCRWWRLREVPVSVLLSHLPYLGSCEVQSMCLYLQSQSRCIFWCTQKGKISYM